MSNVGPAYGALRASQLSIQSGEGTALHALREHGYHRPFRNTAMLTSIAYVANFGGNGITNFTATGFLPGLIHLELSGNFITDGVLTNITWLTLDDNRFTELPELLPFYTLRQLDLDLNRFSRIVIPYSLTNLTLLELEFDPLEEFILPEVLASNRLAELRQRGVNALTYPHPPYLTNLTGVGNTFLSWDLYGMPGVYEVLRSTNLTEWSPEGMMTNRSGAARFSTPMAGQSSQAYFRAQLR